MSEWKRNKIRTNNIPKALHVGVCIEARQRDGTVFSGIVGEHEWLDPEYFNTSDGSLMDILAYRILPSEPAAEPAKPDYSNGFPVGTTAKDIGAKVGDEFVVVVPSEYFKKGEVITLAKDDGTGSPLFTSSITGNWYINFFFLAPIPQKTAIELQAKEVGIPEPVQHVAGEWIEWNGGECPVPKGTLVDVQYRDGDVCNKLQANVVMDQWPDASVSFWGHSNHEKDITAYRLHQPQEIDTEIRHITPANVRVTVDLGIDAPKSAPEFLQSALSTLTQRGKDYDKPEGERSAAAVAVAFNAITGKQITDAEVYLVLQLVKDVRQWQCADFHADSALDCVAYAALKAEALAGGKK